MTMSAPHVFVSHSHADLVFCRAFVNGLRAHHLDVWYDEHNLGWGALRQVIEREMEAREHFVAILSPAAAASEWVSTEIDAALELLREGRLHTFLLVVAAQLTVPLLLRRYKRIEGPGGTPVAVEEAVARTLRVLSGSDAPTPTVPSLSIPPERFPKRLADLGFAGAAIGSVEVILPPVCGVPDGEFLMGSDPQQDLQAFDDETPQHWVTLPAYQIARFPVTVAEYSYFVRAGHEEPRRVEYSSKVVDWQTQLHGMDHPIVNVGWRDALAYAAWLARVTSQPWRLPTEAEWEKAARWDSTRRYSRIYPWDDAFDQSRANTNESGIGATTPVGSYPTGASPYGAQDMAGNVWEWTSSLFRPYPYNASDGRERVDAPGSRVLRGGSWTYNARLARAAYRFHRVPSSVLDRGGFRLVLAVPGE